jgi:hypothetical protein
MLTMELPALSTFSQALRLKTSSCTPASQRSCADTQQSCQFAGLKPLLGPLRRCCNELLDNGAQFFNVAD